MAIRTDINTEAILSDFQARPGGHPGAVLELLGQLVIGDGGGGLYRHDASDTTSAHNFPGVVVDTAARRWKKIERSAPSGGVLISVKSYGAVGDGSTDDSSSVQQALNAVPSGGGTVWLDAGTYIVQNLLPKSRTRIQGPGILKMKAGVLTSAQVFTLASGTTDITLDGIEIDGNKVNQLNGAQLRGVVVNGTRHRITDCFIHHTEWSGIQIGDGVTDTTVDHCLIQDTDRFGVGGAGTDVAPINRCVFESNIVARTTAGSIGCSGVIHNSRWTNNIAYDCTEGTGAYHEENFNLTVDGNVSINSGNHGYHLGGTQLKVSNNMIFNSAVSAIFIAAEPNGDPHREGDFQVTGNMIYTCGYGVGATNSQGIYVWRCDKGIIANNKIQNSKTEGIRVRESSDVAVTGNVIHSTAAQTDAHGILANNGDQIAVSGNAIKACGGSAVRFESCRYSTVLGNTLVGNAGYGVRIWDNNLAPFSTDVTITGNAIRSNASGSIFASSGPNRIIVVANVMDAVAVLTGVTSSVNTNNLT